MRRATFIILKIDLYIVYFNPRSPWGERRACICETLLRHGISIHALREESDPLLITIFANSVNFNPRSPWGERLLSILTKNMQYAFQSTLSVRRATFDYPIFDTKYRISIHALREESDIAWVDLVLITPLNFNPRSPWGERPSPVKSDIRPRQFQSTLSVRRATVPFPCTCLRTLISIHALREESDY